MRRRTKIVCTLGPATGTKEKIAELIQTGMNVARLNCSHGDWDTKAQWIEWVREQAAPSNPVAILVDLQGPKFRLGVLTPGEIQLETGQEVTLGHVDATLIVQPGPIWDALSVGGRILLGDGNVELQISEKRGDQYLANVNAGGLVKSKQGITLVGKSFDVACLTDRDRKDIDEAVKHGVEFIALSYVRQAADMIQLRNYVRERDPMVALCAKIETPEALEEIDEIIKVSDIIMVARGDLGLQVDIEDVPAAQKRIIFHCNTYGKPVITATQMLESMMTSARPTRAEVTDVANAILDGTDAIMLSGETASGEYPLEAVKTMARIAEKTEDHIKVAADLVERQLKFNNNHTEAVSLGAVQIADALGAKAILTTSTSGATPRAVSKHRPKVPILTVCWNKRVQAQMSIVWGVEALCGEPQEDTDHSIDYAIDLFLRQKSIRVDDTVIITAGYPVGAAGNTNLILVKTV